MVFPMVIPCKGRFDQAPNANQKGASLLRTLGVPFGHMSPRAPLQQAKRDKEEFVLFLAHILALAQVLPWNAILVLRNGAVPEWFSKGGERTGAMARTLAFRGRLETAQTFRTFAGFLLASVNLFT